MVHLLLYYLAVAIGNDGSSETGVQNECDFLGYIRFCDFRSDFQRNQYSDFETVVFGYVPGKWNSRIFGCGNPLRYSAYHRELCNYVSTVYASLQSDGKTNEIR